MARRPPTHLASPNMPCKIKYFRGVPPLIYIKKGPSMSADNFSKSKDGSRPAAALAEAPPPAETWDEAVSPQVHAFIRRWSRIGMRPSNWREMMADLRTLSVEHREELMVLRIMFPARLQ